MSQPTFTARGKVHDRGLEFPSVCDECGKPRAHGSHKKCSKQRQARYRQEAAHA